MPVGEDRQRHRGDQQAVLAGPEWCEHAPPAGVGHRLLDVELRTHHSMVADRVRRRPTNFPRRHRRNGALHSHFCAQSSVWAHWRQRSGVGEVRRPALLEGLDALAVVGAPQQRGLAGVLRSSAPSSSVSVVALMASLVFANATTGPRTSVAITLSTSASSSSAGYTAVTRPAWNASAARNPFGQQRHPHRADPADRRGDQRRRAAVGHQADLGEGEHEIRLLRSEYDVARQRQRRADAGGGALHDRDHRAAAAPRSRARRGWPRRARSTAAGLLGLVVGADPRTRAEAATRTGQTHHLDAAGRSPPGPARRRCR